MFKKFNGVALLAIPLLFFVFKKMFGNIKSKIDQTQLVNNINVELSNLNYSVEFYDQLVRDLILSMEGNGTTMYGSTGIYSVYEALTNNDDIRQLHKSFGVKNYQHGYFGIGEIEPLSLTGWLQAEITFSPFHNELLNRLKNAGVWTA